MWRDEQQNGLRYHLYDELVREKRRDRICFYEAQRERRREFLRGDSFRSDVLNLLSDHVDRNERILSFNRLFDHKGHGVFNGEGDKAKLLRLFLSPTGGDSHPGHVPSSVKSASIAALGYTDLAEQIFEERRKGRIHKPPHQNKLNRNSYI
jgi:hypothetical protein